jgi:hypothetical protein
VSEPEGPPVPHRKVWRHERLITEHAFDKLRIVDCGFAEFAAALEAADVIEEHTLADEQLKELVLTLEWKRPLHVVVVVDDRHQEERIVTLYEPDPELWTDGYRRRR